MAGPQYGALGKAFTFARILQAVCLIGIIGMTANFVAMMVASNATPPHVLIGTLSVTCIAVLYCAITWILYYDNMLPFLINTGTDTLLLVALSVVAVTVGKPVSYMNCFNIRGKTSDLISTTAVTQGTYENLNKAAARINYAMFAGASKTTCLEMKAIWGLCIALCILFAFSLLSSVCLWRRNKASVSKPMGSPA